MKTLKIAITFVCLALLFNFTACKKDKNTNEPSGQEIDLKNYSIAGKYKVGSGSNSIELPYLITFSENAKGVFYDVSGNYQATYTFKDGMVKFQYNANEFITFNIDKENITGYDGSRLAYYPLVTFVLQKTPAENLMNGALFNGSLANTSGNLLVLTKLKFNASQYGESSVGDPVINKDYTLINNLAATSNTGANGTLTLFVVINGKLEVSRKSQNVISYGSLTKQ